MKNINKIIVELTFPMGAHFYQNINIFVYKQLMKFIHHLNCLSPSSSCYQCPVSKQCRYYQCTGENFNGYPGILIHNNLFTKSIYSKQENIQLIFYLIGNNIHYKEYITLFFESYLNQMLAQNIFYIKKISCENIVSKEMKIQNMKITSLVESDVILDVINNMIHYYNNHYQCHFNIVESTYDLSFQKHVIYDPIIFKTKKIKPKGFLYRVYFNDPIIIDQYFLDIGIGKYNYIGGGYFENENNIE